MNNHLNLHNRKLYLNFLSDLLIKCLILSRGLLHLQTPITVQSFFNKKSARCEPTMPVIPVISAFFSFKFCYIDFLNKKFLFIYIIYTNSCIQKNC